MVRAVCRGCGFRLDCFNGLCELCALANRDDLATRDAERFELERKFCTRWDAEQHRLEAEDRFNERDRLPAWDEAS